MNRYKKVLASVGTCLASVLSYSAVCGAQQTPLTAIDIAIEPDATMVHHAEATNARLREVFPKGFSLDATHHPHISLLQRYVRTADLEKLYTAAEKVLLNDHVTSFELTANKYYYLTDKSMPGLGLSGIVVETIAKLVKLQEDLIDAVAPYTAPTGTAAAYVTTPADPEINAATIHYVEVYVPEHSGKNLELHVTTGIASADYLAKMVAEPFHDFTFSPVGVSVYHLGNFGTAQRKLKDLRVK
jgi:hypothetical protein